MWEIVVFGREETMKDMCIINRYISGKMCIVHTIDK